MARLSSSRLVAATLFSLLIVGIFGFRITEAERAASKTIGIYLGESGGPPFEVTGLLSGGPAERAGIKPGDRIVGADGITLETVADFDRISKRFSPGTPVTWDIDRGGARLHITLVPGVPLKLWYFPLDGFVLLASLLLFILTWSQPKTDPRSNLLSAMFVLIAISMSLPYETIQTLLWGYTWSTYLIVDALEMAVAIHLVMLIPRRPGWLEQYPSLIPLTYTLFLAIGVTAAAATIGYSVFNVVEFPWPLSHAVDIQWHVGGPVWSLALVLILISGIRHARNRTETLQAQLVLVGLLPLLLLILGMWGISLTEVPIPDKFNQISGLFMLPFLVTVGIAMFRYDLIDMEVVIERGILYSMLTSSIFLIFYASLGIGGALATRLFGDSHPIWIASIAALVLGLMFHPLRRSLHDLIERRIFPERGQQRHRLTRLAAELPASGSVSAMSVRLVESLRDILDVSDVSLFLVDSENGRVNWEASEPARVDAVEMGGHFSVEDAPIRSLIEHGILRNTALPRDLTTLAPLMEATNAEMLIPLESNARLIGILSLGAPSERARAEDEHTLEMFSNNVAMVFENVRLFQSATFDGLTGLPRREIVLERLREEIKRSERHHRALSIAMLDLDHFKNVNDRHGHLVGDSILRAVAEGFRTRLRTTDQIGRFGGEEFIVILPETGLEQALELAEDLRRSVEQIDFHTERGERVQTRVSVGVATLKVGTTPSDPEELISAADDAMYRAKQNGRNRIEMALVM